MTKTRIGNADWSTINLDELKKLPVYDWSGKGYRLQDDSGNGCAGDPPGFPTYFTQSVHTSHGNEPQHGYTQVIVHNGIAYGIEPARWAEKTWDEHRAKYDAMMLRLWKPLPLGHPRTQAWIKDKFSHHRQCYHAPDFKDWSEDMLVWPGGTLGKTPYGELKDIEWEVEYARKHRDFEKWTHDERVKFTDGLQAANRAITRRCEEIATPENHDATILIRRYYPEFQPTAELVGGKFQRPGLWWETAAEQPTPERCPGQYGKPHPVNTSWCQFCGWGA